MSWETHGSQQYYYRVQRGTNGRLMKHYFGTGPAAQRAAEEDKHKRTLRQQERLAQQQVHHLETPLIALTQMVHTLVSATLLGHQQFPLLTP